MRVLVVLVLLLSLSGCALFPKKQKLPPEFPGLDAYAFERTPEKPVDLKTPKPEYISVRFDGLSMREGMTLLTDETGVSIIWGNARP